MGLSPTFFVDWQVAHLGTDEIKGWAARTLEGGEWSGVSGVDVGLRKCDGVESPLNR